ncbi:hypothetical protein [Deinococcus aluminii]|uniref:Uncharacterized protein n=1 Tax=Deinococcus aluminii TaxID=1656885 RepID=A0ABP9XDG8_9DEIO
MKAASVQEFEEWWKAEGARLDERERAEKERLSGELDEQVRAAEAREREAFERQREEARRNFEDQWVVRRDEIRQEYELWLQTGLSDLRAEQRRWERTYAAEQEAQRATDEAKFREQLLLEDPVRYGVRLIVQHGVMTEEDLLGLLPPEVPRKRFRRDLTSYLETLEVNGQPVILTEYREDGTHYLRNPDLGADVKVSV